MSNCPNCGAPITGPECEYCGTRFPRGLRAKIPGIIDDACDISVIDAKIKVLADQAFIKRLYEDAIQAMRKYSE